MGTLTIPRGQREQSPTLGEKENVSLKEWARIVDVKLSFAYEQSRHDRIPGMFRVGKFVRVNLPAFYAAKGIDIRNMVNYICR